MMRIAAIAVASALFSIAAEAATPEPKLDWLPAGFPEPSPDGLCVRSYLTPEMGAITLHAASQRFATLQSWEDYARSSKSRILEGAGLAPMPKRQPLRPIHHSLRQMNGYTVENVAFESIPGFWATGNLYRPANATGKVAAILSLHGHTGMPETTEDWERHGRFHEQAQIRAGALARMGAIVFSMDMFGYGDGISQVGSAAHRTDLAMRMQIWNALRAVDFLESLPETDASRIGVTGESGGGTQTFLLTALDERVAASVPVAMASSYFFGGCPCESGRPIHRSDDHFISNIMIAALAAPRPMLLVSDGGDWTLNTPLVEYPFVRAIYRLHGAEELVENTHLAKEGHNYGPSKRAAMYRFFAKTFGLDLGPVLDRAGDVDESPIAVERSGVMRVFDADHPVPEGALTSVDAIRAAMDAAQN